MRHARRLIAILIGCATWCVAAATAAFAKGVPDPQSGFSVTPSPSPAPLVGDQWWNAAPSTSVAAGTPPWELITFVALGVLIAVAIVGLGYSLSHSRISHSRRSMPSPRAKRPQTS